MNPGYVISELRTHGTDPTWWRKRFLTHVVSRYYTDLRRPEADSLVSLEWDNVLLVDACRFDLFEAVNERSPLPGSLDSRRSIQSGTPAYLVENFGEGEFHDIVYVTANPYVNTKLPDDTFHAVDAVWRDDWDDDLGTVRPETMRDRALAAADRYPDKRLIIHFNQPHMPFIGDVRLDSRDMSAIRKRALGDGTADDHAGERTPFELLEAGDVTAEAVWEAYRSNLERAWESLETLLTELEGLNAVTSDHGNALGERAWPFPIRVYGHPLGILIPALTNVPWHTYRNGDRKTVVSEPPEQTEDVDADTAERLRMLGYAE
jgi:hypothetical protein